MTPSLIAEKVKKDLHISSQTKNDQIDLAVEAAKRLLSIRGVGKIDPNDATTAQCIMLYCRYYFNYQGDAERYLAAFESMANSMAMAGEYRTGREGDEE